MLSVYIYWKCTYNIETRQALTEPKTLLSEERVASEVSPVRFQHKFGITPLTLRSKNGRKVPVGEENLNTDLFQFLRVCDFSQDFQELKIVSKRLNYQEGAEKTKLKE